MESLPLINSEATIITGRLAYPFIKKIIDILDESNLVDVVAVNQDIADLITAADLEEIDVKRLKKNIILPGGSLVHKLQVLELFGYDKNVIRGPYVLTNHDFQLDEKELVENEYNSLKELVHKINQGR